MRQPSLPVKWEKTEASADSSFGGLISLMLLFFWLGAIPGGKCLVAGPSGVLRDFGRRGNPRTRFPSIAGSHRPEGRRQRPSPADRARRASRFRPRMASGSVPLERSRFSSFQPGMAQIGRSSARSRRRRSRLRLQIAVLSLARCVSNNPSYQPDASDRPQLETRADLARQTLFPPKRSE